MKVIMVWCLLLITGAAAPVMAQINTMPADATANGSLFLYEVKLVDEFIERFNDDSTSYIREQSRQLYGTDNMITRARLLKTLFDKQQQWGADTGLFMKQVLDSIHPQYLSFTDSNWYAEAKCAFLWNGQKTEIPLILHIKAAGQGYKWQIAGIGNSEVLSNSQPSLLPAGKEPPTGDYIPTSSHGTGFVVLSAIFNDKMHAVDYFDPKLLATPRGQYLVQMIKQRKAEFQHVSNIRFHFYTISGWVFTVEQYKRKEANTGWLISNLAPVTPQQKEGLLKKLLYQ